MPVIGPWIVATTDKAHAENWGGDHRSGFCKACADVYLTLNHVAADRRGAVKALRAARNYIGTRAAEGDEVAARALEGIDRHLRGQSETALGTDEIQDGGPDA